MQPGEMAGAVLGDDCSKRCHMALSLLWTGVGGVRTVPQVNHKAKLAQPPPTNRKPVTRIMGGLFGLGTSPDKANSRLDQLSLLLILRFAFNFTVSCRTCDLTISLYLYGVLYSVNLLTVYWCTISLMPEAPTLLSSYQSRSDMSLV